MKNLKKEIINDILTEIKENFKQTNIFSEKFIIEKNQILDLIKANNFENQLDVDKNEINKIVFEEYILTLVLKEICEKEFFDKLLLEKEIYFDKNNYIKFEIKKSIIQESNILKNNQKISKDLFSWFSLSKNNVKKDWMLFVAEQLIKVKEKYDIKVKEKNSNYLDIWSKVFLEFLSHGNVLLTDEKSNIERLEYIHTEIINNYKNNLKESNLENYINNLEQKCSSLWCISKNEGVFITSMFLEYLDLLNFLNEKYPKMDYVITKKIKLHYEQISEREIIFINKDVIMPYVSSKNLKKYIKLKSNIIEVDRNQMEIFDFNGLIVNVAGKAMLEKMFSVDKNIISNFKIENLEKVIKNNDDIDIKNYIKITWDLNKNLNLNNSKVKYLNEKISNYVNDLILNINETYWREKEVKNEVREFLLHLRLDIKNNNIEKNIKRKI